MIGIRLANDSFFPVLDEGTNGHEAKAGSIGKPQKKRLILTTVKDNQPTVQIDLYRGSDKDIKKDSYVASLTVENITPMRAGEPDIELIMGKDTKGQLEVHAYDRAGGAENSLSVRLEELPQQSTYDTPDFSFGEDFSTPDMPDGYDGQEEEATAEEQEERHSQDVENRHGRPLWAFILLALGVAAIVVLGYFLLRAKPTSPSATVPPVESAPKAVAPAPAAPAAAPQSSPQKAQQVADGPVGVWYRIAFGDTLWDLAYSFYDNPRQFNRIAQENNISNPNRIYGGRRIFIPLDAKSIVRGGVNGAPPKSGN